MTLVGANSNPVVVGQDEQPGKIHYFIGRDPTKWRADVPQYAAVKVSDVYPGVDLIYYGNQCQLEYDFVVARAPTRVPLCWPLRTHTYASVTTAASSSTRAGSEMRQPRPVIYQKVAGAKQAVSGHYRIDGYHHVHFEVGHYDERLPLMIDPVLVYSTYLGGSTNDEGTSVAVDQEGHASVTGTTSSPDFPTTANAFQPAFTGFYDAFVAKLNRTGLAPVFSTYLGGSFG